MTTRLKLIGLFFFCLGCQFWLNFVWFWSIFGDVDRAWKAFLAYDRFANAQCNGNPNETISSRAGFGQDRGSKSWCILCKFLDVFEKDHCQKSKGW